MTRNANLTIFGIWSIITLLAVGLTGQSVVIRHLELPKDLDDPALRPFLRAAWDRKDELRRAAGLTIARSAAPAATPSSSRNRLPAAPAETTVTVRRTVLVRPTFGAVIHARLAAAGREMLNASREKAQIARAIQEARFAYWSCGPQCPNRDELLGLYAYSLWQKDMYYFFMRMTQAPSQSANIFAPEEQGLTIDMIDRMTGGKLDGGISEACDHPFGVWMTAIRNVSGGSTVGRNYFPDGAKVLAALRSKQDTYEAYSACRENYEYQNRPVAALEKTGDPYDYALTLL